MVEAKLSLTGKKRGLHIRVQAIAYGLAAEETHGYPLRAMLIYEAERNHIAEVEEAPCSKIAEDAARGGRETLQHYTVSPRRCRVCSPVACAPTHAYKATFLLAGCMSTTLSRIL